MHYPWHPGFQQELEVLYREARRGETVFVCRMPDGSGEVVASWMFDAAACAGMAIGPPRVSVAALVELRALLDGLGSDGLAVAVSGPNCVNVP